MTGRGRGESKHVGSLESGDPNLPLQMEAARQLGIPEGQVPVRGRGGFRREELRTIPATASAVSTQNKQAYKQVGIVTNFVEISPMPNRVMYMYRVEFDPQIESAQTLRYLFRDAASKLFRTRPIYDGAFECRSNQELADKTTSVTVQDEREASKPSYKATFTKTGTVAFGPETLRLYNTEMKKYLIQLGYFEPQRGVFVNEALAQEINKELTIMRGFRTAAAMHDGGKILMNLEATHKLMQRTNVLDIMADIKRRVQESKSNLMRTLETELVGKLVVSAYDKRAYRVEGVTKLNPTCSFEKDGQQITYMEYYRRFKNVTIQNQSQPLLLVVPNSQRRREEVQRELHLVPELCNIAGLTEKQRTDNRLKIDLIRASQVKPTERVAQMRTFLRQFHEKAEIQASLAEWGYSYATDAVKLKAFVIPATKIAYGDICKKPRDEWKPSDAQTADIRDSIRLAKPVPIAKMAIICMKNDLNNLDRIMRTLRQGFDQVGLQVAHVDRVMNHDGDRASDYINEIKKLAPDTTCAIVIMSRQNKERYDAIKKAATAERGLITQVVTANLMTMDEKKARSAATKIAIQVAAKVGGEPWWVDLPLKSTMICGYDTYHDTAQRGRSFGAFLASMNDHFSRWWSKADSHDKLEEISSQVSGNMVEAVQQYAANNNGNNPERIIIYRDGVGDGQIKEVFEKELKLIKQALDGLKAPKRIMLTMIIVNKRIGARFYMQKSDTDFDNPVPGTVIDHTVTRAERYDFYLISQSTRQGSITPTYYNIIHDDSGFPPDVHQKMAFKMCLLYYNWAGTVRVPAPCQYAHKLALMCGEHLHRQPNAVLENRLHFL